MEAAGNWRQLWRLNQVQCGFLLLTAPYSKNQWQPPEICKLLVFGVVELATYILFPGKLRRKFSCELFPVFEILRIC